MPDSFSGLIRQAIDHFIEVRRLVALLPMLPCMVIIILTLTACGQDEKSAADPPRPVKYVTVKATTPGIAELMTGDIAAHDETSIAFRLDGRILTRPAQVGDNVRAGELLATQESTTLVNALNSAQAETDSERAAEHVAALNLQRMRQLMPSGAIARAQYDSAQSDWASAVARRKSSEASLNSARENLDWTILKAPFSGVITAVNAAAGQVVSAGQTIISLAYGERRDVVLDVPFPAAFSSASDEVFRVSLLSSPSVTAIARLRDISPLADPQTRTWRVRLTLDNPPPTMLLGASVSVELPVAATHCLTIPASSLTRLAGKPAVFVLDLKRGKIQRREVVISRFSNDEIYIASGIRPGDRVVTAGVSTLQDGETVSAGEPQE